MIRFWVTKIFSFHKNFSPAAVQSATSRGQPCHTSTPLSCSPCCSPSCSTAWTEQRWRLQQYLWTTLPSRPCTTESLLSPRAWCTSCWWSACSASSRLESCSVTFAPRNWKTRMIRTTSTSPTTGPGWWLRPGPWPKLYRGVEGPDARILWSSATLQPAIPDWNDTLSQSNAKMLFGIWDKLLQHEDVSFFWLLMSLSKHDYSVSDQSFHLGGRGGIVSWYDCCCAMRIIWRWSINWSNN